MRMGFEIFTGLAKGLVQIGEMGMIEITIPGYQTLQLKHLILDYNGTLACDGEVIAGVEECLESLSRDLEIHVLTADTFGKVKSGLKDSPCKISVLPVENQDIGKLAYVKKLGCENAVCIGNGRNDQLMLSESALGIAVVLQEGAALQTLQSADVVCTSIVSAFELLLHPLRLTATLRS